MIVYGFLFILRIAFSVTCIPYLIDYWIPVSGSHHLDGTELLNGIVFVDKRLVLSV